MLSLLYSLLVALAIGGAIGYFINIGFGIFIGLVVGIALFFFLTRHFTKKLQNVFTTANFDLQKQNFNNAVEVLKSGYKYNKYAFLVKAQIDSQIGIILYTQKKFGEAYKYLQKSNPRITLGYIMMIIGHIKNNKKMKMVDKDIELLIRFNKKDPFVYSVVAYLYAEELGNQEKALEILNKAIKAMPENQKIKDHLTAFQNNKPYKMDKYGEMWYQLMLDRKALSRLQNKMMRSQQRSMKVKQRGR